MEIIVDVDGVLAETAKAVVALINQQYDTHFTKNDCNTWNRDFKVCTFNQIVIPAMERPDFVRSLEVVVGAQDYMHRLWKDGHTITIATVLPFGSEPARIQWLTKHGIKFHHFVNTLQLGKHRLRADLLIDDKVETVDAFADHSAAMLFDQPWNRKYNANLTNLRVYGWSDVYYQIADTISFSRFWRKRGRG